MRGLFSFALSVRPVCSPLRFIIITKECSKVCGTDPGLIGSLITRIRITL
jgi:hypothetical protein